MSELLTPRTPGALLRAARENHRYSINDVVEATRIKPHIIQALENDDYSDIPAPLYGKGFIKLYAEQVGLDPAPLIRSYLNQYAHSVRPTLKTEIPAPATMNDGLPVPSPLARFRETSGSALTHVINSVVTAARDTLQTFVEAGARYQASRQEAPRSQSRLSSTRRDYSEPAPLPIGRYAAIGFAVLVVAILVTSGISFLSGPKTPVASVAVAPAPVKKITGSRVLRLAEPPPPPYIKLK
jgi:hypothetical protein